MRVNVQTRESSLTTIGPRLLMMCLKVALAVTAFSSMRRMWHLMGVRVAPGGMSMLRAVLTVTLGNLARNLPMMMRKRSDK
jgi:hypothetical protein